MAALFKFTQFQKRAPSPDNDGMTLEDHAERILECQAELARTSRNLEEAKAALQREREAFIATVERRGLFDFEDME